MSAPFFLQLFFDLRGFADSAAEVIELRSSDFTFAHNFDLRDARAVDWENPFDADAGGNAANRERFVDAAMLLGNDRAFEDLKTFSRAFFDFDVNLNGIADAKVQRVFADVLVCKLLENIHFSRPFRSTHSYPAFQADRPPAEECFLTV